MTSNPIARNWSEITDNLLFVHFWYGRGTLALVKNQAKIWTVELCDVAARN
jgi:hypothetical protein